MPKATVKLPNGTVITVDGTAEEAARIVAAATGNRSAVPKPNVQTGDSTHTVNQKPARKKATQAQLDDPSVVTGFDLIEVVHIAKTCDEAHTIEKNILDKRGALHKVLLPLYLVDKYKNNKFSLSSGEISKFLRELGTPMDQRNVSNVLSVDARSFVVGDKARVKGRAVGYKIIRRGNQLLEQILRGS